MSELSLHTLAESALQASVPRYSPMEEVGLRRSLWEQAKQESSSMQTIRSCYQQKCIEANIGVDDGPLDAEIITVTATDVEVFQGERHQWWWRVVVGRDTLARSARSWPDAPKALADAAITFPGTEIKVVST